MVRSVVEVLHEFAQMLILAAIRERGVSYSYIKLHHSHWGSETHPVFHVVSQPHRVSTLAG